MQPVKILGDMAWFPLGRAQPAGLSSSSTGPRLVVLSGRDWRQRTTWRETSACSPSAARSKICSGGPILLHHAFRERIDPVGHVRANAISWFTQIIVHSLLGEKAHRGREPRQPIGVERRNGLAEQQNALRLHRQREGNGEPLLLTARQSRPGRRRACRRPDVAKLGFPRRPSASASAAPSRCAGRGPRFDRGEVGEAVPLLKHHAEVLPSAC